MADEQFKAFLAAIEADEGLQEKLQAAADVDTVVAIAKDAGFTISADDLQKVKTELSEDELNETLEQANGGYIAPILSAAGGVSAKVARKALVSPTFGELVLGTIASNMANKALDSYSQRLSDSNYQRYEKFGESLVEYFDKYEGIL